MIGFLDMEVISGQQPNDPPQDPVVPNPSQYPEQVPNEVPADVPGRTEIPVPEGKALRQ